MGRAKPAIAEDPNPIPAGWEIAVTRDKSTLADTDQRIIDGIIQGLRAGLPVDRIAKAFQVSGYTVLAVRDRSPELIANERADIRQRIGQAIRLGLEQLVDGLLAKKISPGQLPVTVGILLDHKARLDGDANQIVEVRHTGPGPGAFEDRLKRVKVPPGGSGVVEIGSSVSLPSHADTPAQPPAAGQDPVSLGEPAPEQES